MNLIVGEVRWHGLLVIAQIAFGAISIRGSNSEPEKALWLGLTVFFVCVHLFNLVDEARKRR